MVEDHSFVDSVSDGISSHASGYGESEIRVYKPPPTINHDRNAYIADSSIDNPQIRKAVAVPYVRCRIAPPEPRTNFLTLQAWEGVVTAVNDRSFSVRLVDLTGNQPDEEADVDFEDVSKDERSLVRIGAVFLLHVGYATSEGGQRSRTAILRFRRLPVWTEKELSSAERAAQDHVENIHWE